MRVALASGTSVEMVLTPGASRGLVIAPDIGGLRPLFDEMAASLAAQLGRNVVCVEPWPNHTFPEGDMAPRLEAVHELHDLRVVGDLVAAADLLGCADVGILGFCMGGMYVHKAAATGRFDRLASFYGMIELPDNWVGPGQTEPLTAIAQMPTPTTEIAIIGELDPYTPPDAVAKLRATGVEIVSYPNAGHGFVHNPDREDHRAEDAADAWAKALAHLEG